MFNKLRIRTKLLVSFIIVALIAGGIGVFSIRSIIVSEKANTLLYETVAVPLAQCNEITATFQSIRVNLRDLYIDGVKANDSNCFRHTDSLERAFNGSIAKLKGISKDETGKKNIASLEKARDEYFIKTLEFKNFILSKNRSGASALMHGEMLKANNKLQKSLDVVTKDNLAMGKKISSQNSERANSTNLLLMALNIFVIVISVVMGLIITINIQKIIKTVVKQTKTIADAAVAGNLGTRANPMDTIEEFREVMLDINKTLDAVVDPLNVAASYVESISKGEIPPIITASYNGDFNSIKNNLNQCIEALSGLISEMNNMSAEHESGNIDVSVNADNYDGAYREMADGINNMVGSHIFVKKKAMAVFMEFGNGNFEASIEQLPGKKAFINDIIEQVRTNLKALIEDTNMLAQAAVDGQLATRANVGKHNGDFRKIVEGINNTLDSVIGPLNVAAEYVEKISKGDMPAVITDTFNGDFNNIKININTLIKSFNEIISKAKMVSLGNLNVKLEKRSENDELMGALDSMVISMREIAEKAIIIAKGDLTVSLIKRSENDELMGALSDMVERLSEILSQVMETAQNVARGSNEMSNSAVQISSGASEQSASAEEVSASIEEMTSTIQQNSDNSIITENIAVASAQGMIDVNAAAQKSLEAIRKISDKIKIINDIAGKTDILAINAAIEAARAGEQGKGFAVVAAEVRKLAEVSQKAAVEINMLSASSLKVTEESGNLMLKIIPEIQKTAQLVKEIAASSSEQRAGSEQITKAVIQFTQVTQQNAAAAEELSSSSQELASQAELLKETIGFFNTGKQAITAHPATPVQKSPVKTKNNSTSKNTYQSGKNGFNIHLENSDKDDKQFESF